MNAITNWFVESLDYHKGVELLRKYECNNRMLKTLSIGHSHYNMGKLKAELRRIQFSLPRLPKPIVVEKAKPVARPEIKPEAKAVIVEKKVLPKNRLYPPEIEEAIAKRSTLANQREALSNRLSGMSTNQERAEARDRIEKLHAEVQSLHTFVRAFEDSGEVPGKEVEKPDRLKGKFEKKGAEWHALRKEYRRQTVNRSRKQKRIKEVMANTTLDEWEKKAQIDKYQKEYVEHDLKISQLRIQLYGK